MCSITIHRPNTDRSKSEVGGSESDTKRGFCEGSGFIAGDIANVYFKEVHPQRLCVGLSRLRISNKPIWLITYTLDSVTDNASTMSATGHPVRFPHLHNSSVISVRIPASRSQGPPMCTLDGFIYQQECKGRTERDWPEGIYPNCCRITRYSQGTYLGGMVLQFIIQGFNMSYSLQCIHRLVTGFS